MAEQKIYPAGTVDSNGKAWDTVGENIRNGEKSSVKDAVNKAIYDTLDAMYPVGYQYLGELPPLLNKLFTWTGGMKYKGYGSGMYFTGDSSPDYKIRLEGSYSVPILTSADKQKLKETTGVDIVGSAVAIPINTRVK